MGVGVQVPPPTPNKCSISACDGATPEQRLCDSAGDSEVEPVSLCDPEVPHHASVFVFEDVAVVGEVAAVVTEGDDDLDALARPDEDGVAEAGGC